MDQANVIDTNRMNDMLTSNSTRQKEQLASHIQRMKKIESSIVISKKNSSKIGELNSILCSHESILQNSVMKADLKIQMDNFKTDIMIHISDELGNFTKKFNSDLNKKVDSTIFLDKLNLRATKEQLSDITDQIVEFYNKMGLMNSYLEQKRKDEENNRNPMQQDIDRLDNDKADKLEFDQLRNKVEELKEIVDSFDDMDDEDEFDDEDSIEEDVLSLAKSGEEPDNASEESQEAEEINPIESQPVEKSKPLESTFKSKIGVAGDAKPIEKVEQVIPKAKKEVDHPLIIPIQVKDDTSDANSPVVKLDHNKTVDSKCESDNNG